MRPNKINDVETVFANKLSDCNGTKHTLIDTIKIDNGYSIKKIRPKYTTYYYPSVTKKQAICLHFTVGNIKGDIGTLTTENKHVSVNYVVDRQGNIYNLFDDTYWSYHLGDTAVGGNSIMSKKVIGIEISNYGPLKSLNNDELLDAYGNLYCTLDEKEYYKNCTYKGYSYYATMTEKQEEAVAALIKYLCKHNDIPMVIKDNPDDIFKTSVDARNFQGIFYHTSVRKDKFDWPDEMMSGIKSKLFGEPKKEQQITIIEKEELPENEEQTPIETVVIEQKEEIQVEKKETVVVEKKSFLSKILDFIRGLFK